MRAPNRWHAAICDQLAKSGAPLAPIQIWAGMNAAGFRHKSRRPRSTLGARLAELVQMKKLERVGPATYRMSEEAS